MDGEINMERIVIYAGLLMKETVVRMGRVVHGGIKSLLTISGSPGTQYSQEPTLDCKVSTESVQ